MNVINQNDVPKKSRKLQSPLENNIWIKTKESQMTIVNNASEMG